MGMTKTLDDDIDSEGCDYNDSGYDSDIVIVFMIVIKRRYDSDRYDDSDSCDDSSSLNIVVKRI